MNHGPTKLDPTATMSRLARISRLAGGDVAPFDDDLDPVEEQRQARLDVLTDLWGALAPRRFQSAALAQLEPGLRAEFETWLRAGAGNRSNVLLIGPVGTGKSYALWALIRELHYAPTRWSGGPVPELLESLRPDRERRFDPTADVLMLDDIGAERQTDWSAEQLTRLIDSAWNDERPILASSNLAPDALRVWLGERAWSRLAGGALLYGLGGHDRRLSSVNLR